MISTQTSIQCPCKVASSEFLYPRTFTERRDTRQQRKVERLELQIWDRKTKVGRTWRYNLNFWMSGYVLANYSLARRWGVTETECNQPPPRLRFGNIPGNSVSKAETAIKPLIWQAAWQNAGDPNRPFTHELSSTRMSVGIHLIGD